MLTTPSLVVSVARHSSAFPRPPTHIGTAMQQMQPVMHKYHTVVVMFIHALRIVHSHRLSAVRRCRKCQAGMPAGRFAR